MPFGSLDCVNVSFVQSSCVKRSRTVLLWSAKDRETLASSARRVMTDETDFLKQVDGRSNLTLVG